MKTIIKASLLLLMLTQLTFGYSFTYSGPSYITTNFGSSTASATFHFNYYSGANENIVDPRLAIQVDGTLVSGAYDDRSTPSSYSMSLTPGTHTIKFTLYSLGNGYDIMHQEKTTSVSVRVKVKVQNNFDSGDIYVDNTTYSKSSPYYRTSSKNSSFLVGAIDQTDGTYQRIWNTNGANKSNWKEDEGDGFEFLSNSRNTTYTVSDWNTNTTVQANLRKVCNLTFTNSFNGISTTGSIKVNGSTVSAPTAQYQVIDQNTIQVEAITQTYNYIQYNFSHWSDGNTQNPRTITASAHANITAVFVGTAIFNNYGSNNRSLHSNSYSPRVQRLVTLYWNEHVSPNVTKYKIYRSVKLSGNTQFFHIATVNRGTLSYVDGDYFLSNSGGNGVELKYDVRAYYSPDQTTANGGYVALYGSANQASKAVATDSLAMELPVINKFALNTNYPNPFNPTTQIGYQIPENSFVNLIVYNALGQEVAQLVNQNQSMGKYTVKFNASNLPSGVYIYKLQAGEFSSVKKMLLTK